MAAANLPATPLLRIAEFDASLIRGLVAARAVNRRWKACADRWIGSIPIEVGLLPDKQASLFLDFVEAVQAQCVRFREASLPEADALRALRLPHLRSLCIGWHSASVLSFARGLTAPLSPSLEELRIENVSVPGLAFLLHFLPALRSFALVRDADFSTGELEGCLDVFARLEALSLQHVHMPWSSLHLLCSVSDREQTNLRHLSLAGSRPVADDGARLLAERLPFLASLNLASTACGDAAATAIVTSMHGLRHLDLSCPNVTDGWLQGLPREAAEGKVAPLRSLSLQRTALTDAGVAALAEAFPALHTLDLSRCPLLSDRSLPALAALEQLSTLALRDCKRVAEPGLASLLLTCPTLRSLDLRGNRVRVGRLLRDAPRHKWAAGPYVELLC